MSLTASARPIPGKLRHEVDVNGRHVISTDEPESLGGTDAAPAPHELLPAMVASCVSTMIALYAQRHGWALDGLHVDVDYEPDATPRQLAVRVHLPANLDSEQAARLRRVAETCPVQRALQAGFAFDEEVLLDVAPTRLGRDDAEGQRNEPRSNRENHQ
jgi:putative redox protein